LTTLPAIYLPPQRKCHAAADARLRHAYVGFQLDALEAIDHQERIKNQALLATRLESSISHLPGLDRALELRYIAWPGNADNGWQEQVQCYLLARLSGWGKTSAQFRLYVQEFAAEIQRLLTNIFPYYRFAPLTSAQQVMQALSPFPIVDTGELRHRLVESAGHMALPLPLLGAIDIDMLVEMMLLQAAPTMLSLCLEPVSVEGALLSLGSREPLPVKTEDAVALLQRQTRSGKALSVEAIIRVHEEASNQHWQTRHLAALSQRAFLLRVQLAGAGPLGDALIATAVGEVGGPGRLTAEASLNDPSLPLAGGAAWVRPRSTRIAGKTEFALAVENLETLSFLPWGLSSTHAEERALLSLADLSEVGRLFAFPHSALWLPRQTSVLPLPYHGGVLTGTQLGMNQIRNAAHPVILPQPSRPHHLWVVGQTGTGKSTLLESLILQDIEVGHAVVVIDPHGDLIRQLLGKIPAKRKTDVILFDPADTSYPLGINPLEARDEDEKALVVSSFIGLIKKLYDPYNQGITGPRFQHAARNGLLTVLSRPGGTLIDFVRAFTDDAFLSTLLPFVKDPVVRRYWTDQIARTQDFHRSEVLDWVVSKFSAFVSDPTIRRIIGQPESSFSFRAAMDSQKIVLLSLAKGLVGSDNANFLGLILLPKILQAALSRASLPISERREVMLYIDEFQNYATDSLALMLAEARKYRLSLTLANQHVGQLTQEIRDAVIGNVGSILSFRLGLADALAMEQILAPSPITAQHLTSLPNFAAYGRVLLQGQRSPAFTLKTVAPAQRWSEKRAEEIRAFSRKTYGRERAKVDAAMQALSRL